ncbi:MAG TPA: hypothetical protein VLU25_03495 [Acidobacteriota bacterium]|nr:hypothetical protein [Acidobacteriota bacterium]
MAINPKAIELTPEQRKQLAEAAERAGRSWEEVFSEAISAYRPGSDVSFRLTGRSVYEAMVEDGAIGVVKEGLPHDLATNPEHMKGFGSDNDASSR